MYCCIISVPGDRDMFASKEGEASKYSGKKEDSRIRLGDKLFRKNGLFFKPPQKVVQQFFWVAQDLILVQLILIMQKITKKSLLGHFLGYPPKMHYSALQCSAMY